MDAKAINGQDALQKTHDSGYPAYDNAIELGEAAEKLADRERTDNGSAQVAAQGPAADKAADLACGWLCCRPRCLQRLCTAPWLLLALCLATFVEVNILNFFQLSKHSFIHSL